VLALLYTFPLGVWDRVVVTPEQRRDSRVAEVRNAIVQLAEFEASTARSYGSISDPTVRAYFSRAMGSQRAAMLFRIEPMIAGIENRLSVPELILLAYNLAQAGKAARADALYGQALRLAAGDDVPVTLRADIHRMRAQLVATLPGGLDLGRLRADYRTNLGLLMATRSPGLMVQAANSGFEWSLYELAQGDWTCGERLGAWARQVYGGLPLAGPDAATIAQAYEAQRRLVAPRSGTPGQGCDAETEALLTRGT
jgi:hypothetical protein